MTDAAEILPPLAGDGSLDQAMSGFIADFAQKNPNLAWLPQMMAAQRAARAHDDDAPADDRQIEIDALHRRLEEATARGERTRRVAERLRTELDAAHDMLADLAAALGACGECWGHEPGCRSCRGRGRPGVFPADSAQRARFFVEPEPSEQQESAATKREKSKRR